MRWLILINILFTYLLLNNAAVFRGYYRDEDYLGKCVMKDLNLILSAGDIVQHQNKCIRLLCYENSLLIGHSCGAVGPPEGCVLGKQLNATASYPECCVREFICNTIESRERD
ncbi:uncharacterized protein LOC142239032 [Haematobia irritans]|uniref:uncharacterized protein LOC142239032 n=1 Tax=Haematobia irritans TaxID=7368 RepID=UPI003F4F750F